MTKIDSQKLLDQRIALHYTRKEVADRVFISERYLSDLDALSDAVLDYMNKL